VKASEVQNTLAAPHTVELQPSAFFDGWEKRPRVAVIAGLRRLSCDETLRTHTEAAEKADSFHPGLSHDDSVWLKSYDMVRLHLVLSEALVEPHDVTKPWMDGRFTDDLVEMSGDKAVSSVFSDAGLSRLYDEFEVLTILDSPTQPPADDEQLADMSAAIQEGFFFSTIAPGVGPEEEAEQRRAIVEMQMRTLFGYILRLHRDGFAPARG
jgi:hypothetical protein